MWGRRWPQSLPRADTVASLASAPSVPRSVEVCSSIKALRPAVTVGSLLRIGKGVPAPAPRHRHTYSS